MVTEKILSLYKEAVELNYSRFKFCIIGELSTEEYNHVIQIATDLLLSRDGHQFGGHFVQSILGNKLSESFDRADSVCERAIKFFIQYNKFVHLKPF